MARNARSPIVTFATRILTHYRVPFHERLRAILAARGIGYRLLYGEPDAGEATKGDLAKLPWAEPIRNRTFPIRGRPVWQPILRAAAASDLVVLGQENRLLVNYPLQLWPGRRRPRIAMFGHGRNFQARDPDGKAERWKAQWAPRCDWWFGYTDATRQHLEMLGFPSDRITVINNAIDTRGLGETAASIEPSEIAQARRQIGAEGALGLFVGGLYPDKRLGFLVEAADRIRERVPGFTLAIVGGGIDRAMVERLAEARPWLIVTGPKFGRDKVALMCGSDLFLMPGLVGLAVLDAGVLSLPVVTTAYPFHSPEIAYLQHGTNGLIVPEWMDPARYAEAVIGLLADDARRADMAAAAHETATRFTIEAMADRFAAGIVAALAAPHRSRRSLP